jgi:hypothetical protein
VDSSGPRPQIKSNIGAEYFRGEFEVKNEKKSKTHQADDYNSLHDDLNLDDSLDAIVYNNNKKKIKK